LPSNNHNLRIQYSSNDEYYTPVNAITPIIKYLKPNSNILCPFDTINSNYVKVLTEHGFNVIHSHIEQKDFFDYSKEDLNNIDYIISNPPYSIKTEVFEHLFKLNKPFAMLVGVNGIFEASRYSLFANNKTEVLIFDKRVKYFKEFGNEKSSSMCSPPFSSWYICSNVLPEKLVFEKLESKSVAEFPNTDNLNLTGYPNEQVIEKRS